MHVDCLRKQEIIAPAPNVFDDARPVLHHAFVAQKKIKQRIFLGRELHLFIFPQNLTRVCIEHDLTSHKMRIFLNIFAAEQRADRFQRVVDAEREKRRDAETAAASASAELLALRRLLAHYEQMSRLRPPTGEEGEAV